MKDLDLEDGGRSLEIFSWTTGGSQTMSLGQSVLDNVHAFTVSRKEDMNTEDRLFDTLYSAQDHPGGRISSVFLNRGWIELGAQWIHGQNNEVWKLAHKYDLLSTVTSSEGEGKKLIN
jgi:hypothetical protein